MKLLFVLVVLTASHASAQTVDEIVAKHVEARGGIARLKAIDTVRIERTVAATFNDIDVLIVKKRPDLYRSEQTPEGSPNTIVRGFADVAWELAGGRAAVREGAGADAWKLKVTMRSGAVRYVYLDAATFLERRHETTIELAPGRRVATTIRFGDWRDVGGVKFPFAIEEERDAPGQTFVHYTKKIEVNVPVDDSLFAMPKPSA